MSMMPGAEPQDHVEHVFGQAGFLWKTNYIQSCPAELSQCR
jgi:hypothetical protein